MAKNKKPASIDLQIKALEFALSRAIESAKPQSQIFALNNKIKNLKAKRNLNNWLAQ